jgi:hypothetical protein
MEVAGKLVLGLFIYTLTWIGHMDQVGRGDSWKFLFLRLCDNTFGPREGRQLHRPAWLQSRQYTLQDPDVGVPLFAIGLRLCAVLDTIGEILDFTAEMISVLEGLFFLSVPTPDSVEEP